MSEPITPPITDPFHLSVVDPRLTNNTLYVPQNTEVISEIEEKVLSGFTNTNRMGKTKNCIAVKGVRKDMFYLTTH